MQMFNNIAKPVFNIHPGFKVPGFVGFLIIVEYTVKPVLNRQLKDTVSSNIT